MTLGRLGSKKRVEGDFPEHILAALHDAGWVDVDEIPVTVETPDPADSDDESDETPTPPAGNASRDEWAAFASTLGIEVEESAKRDEIRELVEQLLAADSDDESDD